MGKTGLSLNKCILSLAIACASVAFTGCNDTDTDDSPTVDTPATTVGSLRLIGDYSIPTKTMYQAVEFGGISGLDRDQDGRYWAISDDRGGEKGAPRFYNLSIDMDANKINKVSINQMIYLRDQNNNLLPDNRRSADPESIRVAPNGNLYISSEGNFSNKVTDLYQPFVREYARDGQFVREFDIPKRFHYVDNTSTGGRSNKLFESLTVTPNGNIFTANEDALIQDGPLTSMNNGSVIRVVKLDPSSGKSLAEYAYQIPSIPVNSLPNTFAPDNGVSEMLAISENEFIAIERAYADGVGNTIRLVKTKINPTSTDIKNIDSLNAAKFEPMSKQLLLEMPIHYMGIKLDNIEAITWGPTLNNGHRSLIIAADNNFLDKQSTQFIGFEVIP
ncbi:hypothetical protein EC844_107130 [Acinetobacter calcoaceticus]|uniref:Phytase-like domain-containing protein n=1 Tax=Acinetobacter calcoaceticus TaxID=471 RepID=A0A4R1XZF5_ACICA|nr:hypothetical protein EC844_107130 [Acinetobacter calcoaceticus]